MSYHCAVVQEYGQLDGYYGLLLYKTRISNTPDNIVYMDKQTIMIYQQARYATHFEDDHLKGITVYLGGDRTSIYRVRECLKTEDWDTIEGYVQAFFRHPGRSIDLSLASTVAANLLKVQHETITT